MSYIFNFDQYDYPSLLNQEWSGQWNRIGLNDLTEKEQEGIETFVVLAATSNPEQEIDWSDLLLVKSEGEILKDVFGPALSKDPDTQELILEIGANKFPVAQEDKGNLLRCGSLSGEICFAENAQKIKVKDPNSGEYIEVEYFKSWVEFMPQGEGNGIEGIEVIFKARCRLEPLSNPQPAAIKTALRRGEAIAKYFKPISGGQSNNNGDRPPTFKMPELGVGEYQVRGLQFISNGQYGSSFTIHLTDGREVWARGIALTQIREGFPFEVPEDKKVWEVNSNCNSPVTLVIATITPRENGKYSVDCALRKRLPRAGKTLPESQGSAALKSLRAAKQVKSLPSKALPSIDALAPQAKDEKEIDLDAIPF
jgi:hypothetical protein